MPFKRYTRIAVLAAVTIYIGAVVAAISSLAGAERGTSGKASDKVALTEEIEHAAHKYTTFIVARRARISLTRAHRLSFYSQLPDEEACLNAATAGSQTLRIRDTIHSLHGGAGAAVGKRQNDLLSLLRRGFGGRALNDLQMGLVLHALADAYSHTFTANGKMVAYGPVTGHLRDSLLAQISATHKDPDLIADYPGKFKHYTCDLYKTLSRRRSCHHRLGRLHSVIDRLSNKVGDELVQLRALALRYGFNDWHYRRLGLKYGITNRHAGNPVAGCAGKIPAKDFFAIMAQMERKFAR